MLLDNNTEKKTIVGYEKTNAVCVCENLWYCMYKRLRGKSFNYLPLLAFIENWIGMGRDDGMRGQLFDKIKKELLIFSIGECRSEAKDLEILVLGRIKSVK